MADTKFCPFCNNEIHIEAVRCKYCKNWLNKPEKVFRKFLDTLLLSWFLGVYGIHRFFTGYYVIGLIQLLTFGGCGIWSMIDFVSICIGNYKDANGFELEKYDRKLGIIILTINIVGILLLLILIFAVIMFGMYMCAKG